MCGRTPHTGKCGMEQKKGSGVKKEVLIVDYRKITFCSIIIRCTNAFNLLWVSAVWQMWEGLQTPSPPPSSSLRRTPAWQWGETKPSWSVLPTQGLQKKNTSSLFSDLNESWNLLFDSTFCTFHPFYSLIQGFTLFFLSRKAPALKSDYYLQFMESIRVIDASPDTLDAL